MTPWRYILSSLRQYRRVHSAVAAGVAVTTAVITGALLVGDSMRGSLRSLALKSLGPVDAAVLAEHPFREAMLHEWSEAPAVKETGVTLTPLILTQGAAVFRDGDGQVHRAAQLQVIGAGPDFFALGTSDNGEPPLEFNGGVVLTESIANELGVKKGDAILLRIPALASTPAESSLGEKEEVTASRRLEVTAILADSGNSFPARFSLRPSQQPPRNVFVSLKTLQELLKLNGRANAAAVLTRPSANGDLSANDLLAVQSALQPQLEDYGVSVEQIELGNSGRTYLRISSDRLVLAPQ
jgi:hypothetical protein